MTLKISDWQVFCRKADLKLMGNSQENTCGGALFSQSCTQKTCSFSKIEVYHSCFLLIFQKFSEHIFYTTLLDACLLTFEYLKTLEYAYFMLPCWNVYFKCFSDSSVFHISIFHFICVLDVLSF